MISFLRVYKQRCPSGNRVCAKDGRENKNKLCLVCFWPVFPSQGVLFTAVLQQGHVLYIKHVICMPINFFLVYQNTFHTMQMRLTPDISPDCCFRVSLRYPKLIFIISLSKIRREEVNPFFKKHNALQIIKRIWGFTTIHVPGMDNYGGSQVTSTNQNRDMFTKQTIS